MSLKPFKLNEPLRVILYILCSYHVGLNYVLRCWHFLCFGSVQWFFCGVNDILCPFQFTV